MHSPNLGDDQSDVRRSLWIRIADARTLNTGDIALPIDTCVPWSYPDHRWGRGSEEGYISYGASRRIGGVGFYLRLDPVALYH